MMNLGGVPQNHIYVEACSIHPDSINYDKGECFIRVWYEGKFYKTAEIQEGVLRATEEHWYGRSSCFDIPLDKLVRAVKLLKPTEVTHADILVQKIAFLGMNYRLLNNENIEFDVISNQNYSRGSTTEVFLNLKLVEAAGLDKNPEDLVFNVIAIAILSKSEAKFPQDLMGSFLFNTCNTLYLEKWNELSPRLAIELEKLSPNAKVKVEVVTREAHPEFHDIHQARFLKITLDESEAFLAFGASRTNPAYIYYKN